MGSVWLILGVPAGKRRSGFTLVAFCCGCSYFSSVSPHVENCACFLSTAKRLPLQSLTQRQKCISLYIFDCKFATQTCFCLIPRTSLSVLNWHPCQFLDTSFLQAKNIATAWNHCLPWQFWKCTSLYIAQRQVFAQYCHGGQAYWAETMFAFANSQVNLQHGRCKLMQHRLLSIGNL